MTLLRSCLIALAGLLLSTALHADTKPLPVVASFSILGDVVQQIGGDAVTVTVLVGPGGDAHVYEPTPTDAKAVASAGLLVTNGLGFEGWMDRLISASGYKGKKVVASEGVPPLHSSDGAAHGTDPHAWQSVPNVVQYTRNIEQGLCEADSAHCAGYRQRAERYRTALTAMDAEIRQHIATVPTEARKVITSHDAFGYYAREYGVTFMAPVGISTEEEASAKDVATLIQQIRKEKVQALFVENISDPRLLEQIAHEAGVTQQGTLYSDALSDNSEPATTYLAMMRHNTEHLVAGMSGKNTR